MPRPLAKQRRWPSPEPATCPTFSPAGDPPSTTPPFDQSQGLEPRNARDLIKSSTNRLGRADYLYFISVRVVDVERSHALQDRVDAVSHLDPALGEVSLQLVVALAFDPEREVVQGSLLLLSMAREIRVRVRVRHQHDQLWDATRLGDHQELVGHLWRRHQLEPEPVLVELERRLHIGDPKHDLGEAFDAAHAASADAKAAMFFSCTRGDTEHPGATISPRPPVSRTAARASSSIFGGGP